MSIQVLNKLFHVLLFLSPLIVSSYSEGDIKSLCSRLPHPGTCEYYLSTTKSMKSPNSSPNDVKQDVLKKILKAVLDHANQEGTHINTLGTKCRNNLEKTAWLDCQELYKHTIEKLNKTSDPNSKCSQEDMQTWLSAAHTNLQTCEDGFVELGVTDYIMTLILSKNVTNMISNALALNNVPFNAPSYKDGFPTWVRPGDRKLLEAPVQPPSWWPSIAEPPTFMAPAHAPSAPPPETADAPMPFIEPDVVVAKDGSGDFMTLTEAVSAASSRTGNGRFVIYMKEGVYNENVEIRVDNIMLVGDGIGKTIITGSKSVGGGTTTFRSATVAVVGDNFMARGITFRNTAGPQNHQAVALRSGSDFSVFYRCSFEAYQDTLYVHSERQFYKECDIYGTVDFIFGNAAVVLQNCNIKPRNPPNRTNTLTAQSRMDPNENTGIIIHNCIVTPSDELIPVQSNVKTFLGRPWRQYSRVVYMKTFLDSFIHPEGWMEWDGNFALDTLFYAEFANTGLGSSTANRVTWKGYHSLTSPSQVSEFTVANFLLGNSWLPAAGVPFTPGL